ncbi:hypothetical protein [Janthinobacterium sp. HH104]|uniref:hypothetical protein n=1 Tax=Janthinobacterium sp. HH104 TaxID=1537276 RepID=UPI0011131460|nr:hypothetical protein [Janthinobacterium sp. HH104]
MITTEDDDSGFPRRRFEETPALVDLLLWSSPTSMIRTRKALSNGGPCWQLVARSFTLSLGFFAGIFEKSSWHSQNQCKSH